MSIMCKHNFFQELTLPSRMTVDTKLLLTSRIHQLRICSVQERPRSVNSLLYPAFMRDKFVKKVLAIMIIKDCISHNSWCAFKHGDFMTVILFPLSLKKSRSRERLRNGGSFLSSYDSRRTLLDRRVLSQLWRQVHSMIHPLWSICGLNL